MTPLEQNRLQSYTEANLFGRSIYDNFYRHATISFAFNAIVITAVGFMLGNQFSSDYADCRGWFVIGLSSLGVIFNLGALFSYKRSVETWERLHKLVGEMEREASYGFLRVQDQLHSSLHTNSDRHVPEKWQEVDLCSVMFDAITGYCIDIRLCLRKIFTVYHLTILFFGLLVIIWTISIGATVMGSEDALSACAADVIQR